MTNPLLCDIISINKRGFVIIVKPYSKCGRMPIIKEGICESWRWICLNYKECNVLCNLKKKKEPLISTVPIDEFTDMVQNNFDYDFTGESKFFPYEFPKN